MQVTIHRYQELATKCLNAGPKIIKIHTMKIVLIGGGEISSCIIETAPCKASLTVFKLRDLVSRPGTWHLVESECLESNIVVFLACHHKSLKINVFAIWKILRLLSRSNWGGAFVFTNSQAALSGAVFGRKKWHDWLFGCDIYTFTKRIQSKILKHFDNVVCISEVYLPIVNGGGTRIDQKYSKIAEHNLIFLPNAGLNNVACLNILDFSNWFWLNFSKIMLNKDKRLLYRKFFLYQTVTTFSNLILKQCAIVDGLGVSTLSTISTKSRTNIQNCEYRFLCGRTFFESLVVAIKMSPVWLVCYIIYQSVIRKDQERKICNNQSFSTENSCQGLFYPSGPDYLWYSTSINLSKINFNIVKIPYET